MAATMVPDAHCHLDLLAEPERAIEAALVAGVGPILTVATEQSASERALQLREAYPGSVLVAVGVHPSTIPKLDDAELEAELDYVRQTLPAADALGEVGLDFRDATDDRQRERQRRALDRQLDWAAQHHKPVSVHNRRAEHEIVDRMAAFVQQTSLGVNLHWFTHSEKLARRCAAHGLYISPGPAILHSEPQAGVARCIEAQWLLLETDSPVEFAGEPAQPAWARQVAEQLAVLRGLSLESLSILLQENFRRYLGAGS